MYKSSSFSKLSISKHRNIGHQHHKALIIRQISKNKLELNKTEISERIEFYEQHRDKQRKRKTEQARNSDQMKINQQIDKH